MCHCRDDAKTLSEPEWFGMLSILGRCTDGNILAHQWSKPYPEYSYSETENKLAHAMEKGPHTCRTIKDKLSGKQYCKQCKHSGEIKSPIVLGKDTSKQFRLTDAGNAERMAHLYRKRLRFLTSTKSWLVWNGCRWKPDRKGEAVYRFAKKTIRSICTDKGTADREMLNHAHQSESANKIKNMLMLASWEEGIPVEASELDRDDWLLCCNNGTIDLKTGELRASRRTDLITKKINVTYDRDAECPKFLDFMDKVLLGDQEEISFLQRATGYTLTGSIREQCLFFLYGKGSNGKSTFLEIIRGILGDYSRQTNFDTFLKQTGNQIREDLARLQGARYVTAIEIDKGRQLSEVIVKQVTGGDIITARYLRKNSFEFRPKFKVFWAANDKPEIWGNDYAIWRRLHLINFKHKFDKDDPINTINDYGEILLREEASGILNWALAGCLDWQKRGLRPPRSIRDNTAKYRSEQDVLGRFLSDRVENKIGMRVLKGELYDAYKNWCDETGERIISKKQFGNRIKEKNIKEKKSGKWYWLDICLKSSDDTAECADCVL